MPPAAIVRPKISATKAGLAVDLDRMEAHFLAGGSVEGVILALISADKANIDLSFERAASIDLAGRDVLEAVKVSVNPKVINTPLIAAVAKDGIQVKATSRVSGARQHRPPGGRRRRGDHHRPSRGKAS